MKGKILKTLFLSILFAALFTAAAAIVYMACDKYFNISKEDSEKAEAVIETYRNNTKDAAVKKEEIVNSDISVIIVKEPDEEGHIQNLIAARMCAEDNRLVLITLDGSSRIMLSSEFYSKITADAPAMPQIFEVKNLFQGIGEVSRADKIRRIFKDYLSMQVEAVFILPEEVFEEWFTQDSEGKIVLSENAEAASASAAKNLYRIFEELYETEGFESTMDFSKLMFYLEYFEKLNTSNIDTYAAPGNQKNEYFVPDTAAIRQKLYYNAK